MLFPVHLQEDKEVGRIWLPQRDRTFSVALFFMEIIKTGNSAPVFPINMSGKQLLRSRFELS